MDRARGLREVWADFDDATIVVYQAYGDAIADAALEARRFVPPFSLGRMTWIKPSFLWMMERCGWAEKAGQTRVLAVRITRAGWEQALAEAALTHPAEGVYRDSDHWNDELQRARVRVQWDPERDLGGGKLSVRSIQVGLGRGIVEEYVERWCVALTDLTERVQRMRALLRAGDRDGARRQLPAERRYPVPESIAGRLGIETA
jgi:hypothetical protein